MIFQKNIWRAALCLLAAPLVLSSCESDEKDVPFLSVTVKEMKINHLGFWYGNDADEEEGNYNTVKANFEVGTNVNWTAEASEDWIQLNRTSGERGRYRLFVTVDRNNTGRDREGEITVKAGEHTETIYIDQVYKSPAFRVTSSAVINASKGGSVDESEAYIVILSNDTWEVEPLADWLSVDRTTGGSDLDNPEEYRVLVTVDPNTTNSARQGEIEVRGGSQTVTITVEQGRTGLYADIDVDILVNMNGEIGPGVQASFDVVAEEAWTLTSGAAWLTADVTGGNAGTQAVTLNFDQNNTGSQRNTVITLTSASGLVAPVAVIQTASAASLMGDDGHPVGYEYYYEPFDWCIPFGADDQVMNKGTWSNVAIYNNNSALEAFQNSGLTDYNPGGKCVYLMSDYLKFGSGGNQSGVILPSLPGTAVDKVTNITLTFNVAPNVTETNYDKVEFTVEITSGPGTVNGYSSKTSQSMPHSITTDKVWEPKEVTLYNVTSDTRIAIRSTQQSVSGYFRWFLDEIKCVKHSKVE